MTGSARCGRPVSISGATVVAAKPADYGDYTGAVTQGNSNTLQQLILQVRQ